MLTYGKGIPLSGFQIKGKALVAALTVLM